MRENLIIALEAAWELDPIRLENKLWDIIAKSDNVCYNLEKSEKNVEKMSNGIS